MSGFAVIFHSHQERSGGDKTKPKLAWIAKVFYTFGMLVTIPL
jgi:hypothetical protein